MVQHSVFFLCVAFALAGWQSAQTTVEMVIVTLNLFIWFCRVSCTKNCSYQKASSSSIISSRILFGTGLAFCFAQFHSVKYVIWLVGIIRTENTHIQSWISLLVALGKCGVQHSLNKLGSVRIARALFQTHAMCTYAIFGLHFAAFLPKQFT